jgi:predicted kinase
LLTNGYEVIIDCCNLGQKRRKRWIKAAESTKKEIVKVAVIFPNKSKVWHVNNRMKEPHNIDNLRSYWEKVYDLHKSQFEPIDVTMFDDVVHVESL